MFPKCHKSGEHLDLDQEGAP